MTSIITLLVLGILLLLIEIIIPGGVIGVIGLLCIISGVILAFMKSALLGVILFAGVVIVGFVSFLAWIKFFPKTPMGKEIFLDKDAKDWQGYEGSNKDLIGSIGVCHTDLRPSGLAIINSRRLDVVTQGEPIEKGEQVKVIEVEGNRIVVTNKGLSSLN